MGTPQQHLPPALSEATISQLLDSLSLPQATTIKTLQSGAAFHSIYLLTFPPSAASSGVLSPAQQRNEDGTITLVLRVSGNHYKRRKTMNEVATIRWIRQNTDIPVPAVVRFDASEDNVLGHEFTLLEKADGASVDTMYDQLSEEEKMSLMRQLTDVLLQMNAHQWKHVGGLQIDADNNEVVPGPVMEETMWLIPDLEKYWPGETMETMNPTGPYDSHAGLVEAYLQTFIQAISKHESLAWMRSCIPRLELLSEKVRSMSSLSDTPLILAHKDLHFGNIMARRVPPSTSESASSSTIQVTAILDWEFAGVVPTIRWDPSRAFLWSAQSPDNDEGAEAVMREKNRMRAAFEDELAKRGVERWWVVGEEAEAVWDVIRFVRAVTEVCPKGQRGDKVRGWLDLAEEALKKLGC